MWMDRYNYRILCHAKAIRLSKLFIRLEVTRSSHSQAPNCCKNCEVMWWNCTERKIKMRNREEISKSSTVIGNNYAKSQLQLEIIFSFIHSVRPERNRWMKACIPLTVVLWNAGCGKSGATVHYHYYCLMIALSVGRHCGLVIYT